MRKQLLPQSFTNITTLILAAPMIWRKYFFTVMIYNVVVGFFTTGIMSYCNSLIFAYLIQAEETGQVPSKFLSRLLILGEIGTFLTFFPALLLCSFFTYWQLGAESTTIASDSLKTLIKKTSSASILLGSGWMHAIIKAANPVFGVLIFLCISGFLSGKYQNEWLDTILLVLNSLWLSLLLLKLSKLITFPWFALGSKPNEIKRSKLQVKDGATWLILTSWVIALALTLFLQSCLRFDYQQANITHQLIKQAINFYVPQPFLWFIAVVAREYAVITPRKTWTLRRSLSKN